MDGETNGRVQIIKVKTAPHAGYKRIWTQIQLLPFSLNKKPPYSVNIYHAARGFTKQMSGLFFLEILLLQSLFHKLLNQYLACLYLFECISHGDSKYNHKIPEF